MLIRNYVTLLALFFMAAIGRAADDYCFNCHATQEGTSNTFKNDVHYANALSCADCHGGDPTLNDMDLPKTAAKGFRLRVQREEVPLFCAGCHSNAKFMATYKSKLPTNQLARYSRSVHGQKLSAGRTEAAECIDCHGIHDIRAAKDPASPVNAKNVTGTCAKCHADVAAAFKESPHDGKPLTTCIACHDAHDAPPATLAMLDAKDGSCATCHGADSKGAKAAAEISDILARLADAGPDGREKLQKARILVHSFNVETIKAALDAPPATGNTTTAPAASRPGTVQ